MTEMNVGMKATSKLSVPFSKQLQHSNGHVKTGETTRPSVSDLHSDEIYAATARQHWFGKSKVTFNPQVVAQLFASLEEDEWVYKNMLILENLQYVEAYLWPYFDEDATDIHVLSLALMLDVKRREKIPIWGIFEHAEDKFSQFFRRVLILALSSSLSFGIRTRIISFIILAFQSLEHPMLRKQCAPLVSISIWQHLSSEEARNTKLEKHPQFKKIWKASLKRFAASDEREQARFNFDRSWLYLLLTDFFNALHTEGQITLVETMYCERILELLIDLLSQLPTRRYVKSFLEDLHLPVVVKTSQVYKISTNGLFRDMYHIFMQMLYFAVDDSTSEPLTTEEVRLRHYDNLARLQRTCLKNFRDKLTLLALANLASIERKDELAHHLSVLDDSEVRALTEALTLRYSYSDKIKILVDRAFLVEAITTVFCKHKDIVEVVTEAQILPTEQSLYDEALLRNEWYDGTRSLAMPKLNLQYLTVRDLLWRTFLLHRASSFFAIKRDIEESLARLRPRFFHEAQETRFDGSHKMALTLSKIAILEVAPPRVGEEIPGLVRAEVELYLESMPEDVRRGWDDLRPDDVVFLVAVKGLPDNTESVDLDDDGISKYGIRYIRTAEVIQMFDQENRPIQQSGRKRYGKRKLHLKLDATAFQDDKTKELNGGENIYDSINLIIRRKGLVNNFKPILHSIQTLISSPSPLPAWFTTLFLGYGDPTSSAYIKSLLKPHKVDYYDTFLDWNHISTTLGETVMELTDSLDADKSPPYVLHELSRKSNPAPTVSKKQKRDSKVQETTSAPMYQVSSYKLLNSGPYPIDKLKHNGVRFTTAQIQAIMSGTNPGLTIVHGPPGTGKTDVATQITSNIYHNFPSQRTLLIAHSNQALNQLFDKITKLNVDERHLLRLGHGEEYLLSNQSYSKFGRVESFMDNRNTLLSEVDRLANSLGVLGAHGNSCETAAYFYDIHVLPRWKSYIQAVENDSSPANLIQWFPFREYLVRTTAIGIINGCEIDEYFSNAAQPLFPVSAHIDNLMDIARGCFTHIEKIFAELNDGRPFEILRTGRDKANYLLMKEARIIAMTSTHAAIKREEIFKQGFAYHNVIIEEAAQMTEIEALIPLTLQDNSTNNASLNRIILCGDHYQNSPIIQHGAFREYANMEQSMFARLIRLGVPAIKLDQQGRARPSIAELYRWRYPFLHSLDTLRNQPEYLMANAGFRFDYQFINVDDYKGHGEQEPSQHFIQNLGEAEYAVAIFQYMRLLGYPASKISILTTYAGQQSLIRDVLGHRCAKNPLFGHPQHVTTVDKFQGEQNDYVIVSLVRTKRVGYLRDIRRITVALSRARLGLYILGRRSVFESCYELSEPFKRLLSRPDKLNLVVGEMWPTQRSVEDEVEQTEMNSVEHIGQYVFEMANTKIEALSKQGDVKMQGVETA